jgi:hypothetical protein
MPRFFFHLYDDEVALDREGCEFADAGEAVSGALSNARWMAAEAVKCGRLDLDHRIEVADEAGAPIATIRFGDVIAVRGSSMS